MPLTLPPGGGVLQVGRCRVELASREITGPAPSRLRRLTPKAVAVLRHLAAAGGQVLTRDYLLARVWADSEPTDDVLTQAITQLRKAFAALDPDQPYIETIARSGYRLLVEAAELPAVAPAPAGLPAADEAASGLEEAVAARLRRRVQRRRRRYLVFGVLVLLLLVCLGLVVRLAWQQRTAATALPGVVPVPAGVQRPYRLLTATLEAESDPALSADGRRIAYVRPQGDGSEVVVQELAPNTVPRVLTAPPPGARDRQPVWSPDGSRIAFARQLPDGSCAVLLAQVDGDQPPVPLVRCDHAEWLGFDFSPDGQALLFGSSADVPGDGAVARLQLDTRQWTVLSYPRRPGDLDVSPRLSPDGRWLVFLRNPMMGQLWRMPAGGGTPQPLGQGLEEIGGFAWLPDSRHLLVTRWVGMEMRLFLVDALDEAGWPGVDLGVDQATMPAIARQVPLLAFVHRPLDSHLGGLEAGGGWRWLAGSSGQDLLPAVAPDGLRVLFVSNRSGVPAFWLGGLDGHRAPVRVPGVQPGGHQPAAWSPDGSRVLVVGRDADGRRQLYEIDPGTLGVVRLPVPGGEPLQAAYTDDPDSLLVIQAEAGRPRLVRVDRSRTPWQVTARVPDVTQVRWDGAGRRVLYTRLDRPGLWALPSGLSGRPVDVVAGLPLRPRYRSWTVDGGGGVWMASPAPGCALSLRHAVPAGTSDERCLGQDTRSLPSGFSGAGPDGPVLPLGRIPAADIGLMALPGTAGGQLPDDVKLLIGK